MTRYAVLWSRQALARLAALADWIAQRSAPAVALLFDRAAELADQPRLGARWEPAGELEVRRLSAKNYLVYYLVDDEQRRVVVLTVRHGRERPPAPDEVP